MDYALYNDAIQSLAKDHSYAGTIDYPDCEATLDNPLCGDRVTVQIRLDGSRIADIRCQVRGCLLCKASSSLLASCVRGRTLAGLIELRDCLARALAAPTEQDAEFLPLHEVFRPVRKHRSRHSCVLLPYDGAVQALSGMGLQTEDPVITKHIQG
ncbi:MAG: iron-sulfur cluster assembly scaffold protein [Deltaproteobacteria bacterium]|nr:iron-sulfur cluster assembly scaffold protein [Deltaproteobacteria bacterium]